LQINMKNILTILIGIAFLQAANAQRSLTITYRTTGQLNAIDLRDLSKNIKDKKNIVADTTRKTDSLEIEETAMETELESLIISISNTPLIETRRIYREGDHLIIRNDENRVFHKYNIKTLVLTVLDSSLYPTFSRVDTTFHPMLDEKFIYTLKKTNETQIISGYLCEKFVIEQENNSDDWESRELIIWATREIKPSLPVFAVLNFHKILLEEYTPLKISEKIPRIPNSSNETEVIKIEKN
jgi:hypothetical protein